MGSRASRAVLWAKERPKPLELLARNLGVRFFVDEETGGLRIDNFGPFRAIDVQRRLIPWLRRVYGATRG
jgi:hypothetical protein